MKQIGRQLFRFPATDVEDWFNTYLFCSRYVSWCTIVWFMFMHVVVIIGFLTFGLATGYYYTYGIVCVKVSHRHTEVVTVVFA